MKFDTGAVAQRVLNCPHCEHAAIQTVIGEATTVPEDVSEREYYEWEYTMLHCTRCRQVSLQRKEIPTFYDEAPGPNGETGFEGVFVFPAARQLSTQVPEPLRREFEEAQACFTAEAFTATVVMVRRTLEGIYKDAGINEKTLAGGLRKMRDSGLMDSTLSEWADGLRVLGNQGAHFTGTRVSRADASDALAFTEALLDQIYVLRRRFEEFKQRRDAKRASSQAGDAA